MRDIKKLGNKSIFLSIITFFLFSTTAVATTPGPQIEKNKSVINFQHWKTTNGAQVYFSQSKQVPMVDIAVVFAAGAARDGEHPGIAQFTNNMLSEGAGKLNADQIAQAFDSVGAEFSSSVDHDMAIVDLRSLVDAKFLQPALNTFIQIINSPSFPLDSFQRLKKQTLQSLKLQQQSPEITAKKAFYAALYGQQPYGHPILGTTASVSALIPGQLQQFYQQYYVANNAIIVIVGDLTRETATTIANQVTANLPAGKPATQLALAKPDTLAPAGKLQKIPFPSEQTHILLGQIGISYQNPDFFPLMVGNYILGAQPLIARLFKQVRIERGLAYSVASQFKPLQENGPFVIAMQTRTDKAMEALEVSKKTLTDFIQHGPTDKELEAAKKSLIGSFPLGIASNSAIASKLVLLSFYNLPLDFFDTYREKIAAVTIPQIQQAFAKHLKPTEFSTVMVGQFPADKTVENSQRAHEQK